MNEIDRYLDQVCRTLGGSHSLRQHIREELCEHLEDAIEAHVAKGLPHDEAVRKAINEFGRPEDVGKGLEGVYGHRMMALAIDKAMEWKERTMKSGWKWSFVAGAALLALIATELIFIMSMGEFIIPQAARIIMNDSELTEPPYNGLPPDALGAVGSAVRAQSWFPWLFAALLLAAWAVFERHSKSEAKPLIRVGAGACVALFLAGVVAIVTIITAVPLVRAGTRSPYLDRAPVAVTEVATARSAMADLRNAVAEEDWASAKLAARSLEDAVNELRDRHAAPILAAMRTPATVARIEHLLTALSEKGRRLNASLPWFQPENLPNRARSHLEEFSASWEEFCRETGCESVDMQGGEVHPAGLP